MIQIAYIISDCGDGSASVRWFKDVNKARAVVHNDVNCDSFGINEGQIGILTLPDNTDIDAIGITQYEWDDGDFDDEGNPI